MARAFWSAQEVDILKQMVTVGKDISEIQKVLISRTTGAIMNKIGELGLSMAGKTEIDFEAFKKIMRSK